MSRILLLAALFLTLPAYAQEQAFTGIKGRVTDSKTGEPLMLAPVKIISGGQLTVETDLEGNFSIALPPGQYNLRFWADGYKGLDVVGTRVFGGHATTVNMKLELIDVVLEADEVVVVAAEPDRRSEVRVLEARKLRAAVSDAVSAQELSRTGDSNAADAVKRVVGATVAKDKSVSLRGLGGRHAATLVNGVALPSADPDGHQAPIDLLPSSMVESLTIQKSYGAELPGSFSGGALSLETNSFPRELELKARLSTGANSITTLKGRGAYSGGSLDFFGMDDGTRQLPAQIRATRGPITSSSARELGSAFTEVWTAGSRTAMPNLGVGLSAGDTVSLRGAKLGYLASVGFGHDEAQRNAQVRKPTADGTELTEDLRSSTGGQSGALNALANVGLAMDDDNEVGLLSLYTRRGETSAEVSEGDVSGNNPESATRLQFKERSLFFNQLRGTHRVAHGDQGVARWQLNYSMVNANEPDTRDLKYEQLPDGRERFKQGTGSAERFYSWLVDQTFGGSADYRRQLGPASVNAGLSATRSVRAYDARRFRYTFVGSSASALYLPPEELLSGDSLQSNFALREATLPTDSYDGALGVLGAFASAEGRLFGNLRASVGLRFELATQEIVAGSPFFSGSTQPLRTTRSDPALLPALNLVYGLTENQNLRGSYSYTTVRPQFRELSPVLYVDFVRRRNVTGNPELLPSRIHNGDLRWEWFPTVAEVFAASVFYKQFENPIEAVIIDSHGSTSFANTAGAYTAGVELEGRVGLERIAQVLNGLRAGANLSLIRSEVSAAEGETITRDRRRPLQGQAPWVVNGSLGYAREQWGLEVTALYNVSGPVLSEVGANYLPNAYEQPFHSLDLTASKAIGKDVRLKVSARNLLDQAVVIEQAGVETLRYRPGISGSLAFEWTH